MTKFRRRTALGLPVPQHALSENMSTATPLDVQALAKDKTEAALNVLAVIMYRETANAFARVAAAKELLDRGWGKPVQPLTTDASPRELVHQIQRIIIHPKPHQSMDNQAGEAEGTGFPQTVSPREEFCND